MGFYEVYGETILGITKNSGLLLIGMLISLLIFMTYMGYEYGKESEKQFQKELKDSRSVEEA
jgi:ABC-type transport system involved in cytochrome bd biosynthesis fused ATPase/permease subunit